MPPRAHSWAPLAQAQGGVLIVAAPTPDLVLYSGEDSSAALDALRTFVRNVMARTPKPLSGALLRWTGSLAEPLVPASLYSHAQRQAEGSGSVDASSLSAHIDKLTSAILSLTQDGRAASAEQRGLASRVNTIEETLGTMQDALDRLLDSAGVA